MATRPRTPTTATATTIQTQVFTLPAMCAPQQPACLLDAWRVVPFRAQRLRRGRLRRRGRPVAAGEGQARELRVRAAGDPRRSVAAGGFTQVGQRGLLLAQTRAGGAPFIPPERFFPRHALPRLLREHRQTLGEEAVRLREAAGAKRGRAGLEDDQAIARIHPPQAPQDLERLGVSTLTVVY